MQFFLHRSLHSRKWNYDIFEFLFKLRHFNNEIDFLTCPKCQGRMRIISFIEDDEVIEKILKHLGLWEDVVRADKKRALKENWPLR